MIKLIASDMDGTLVSSDHHILEKTASTIRRAQQMGTEFIVTTGRSYEDTFSQVQQAGIDCNYLVMNGSELRDKDGAIIQAIYLKKDTVRQIVAELMKEDLYIELYTTGGIYSPSSIEICKWAVATKINNFHSEISLDQAYIDVENHFLFKEINPIKTLEWVFDQGYEVGKILSFSSDHQKIKQLRDVLPDKYQVNATGSFAINLEITNPKADKGNALEAYIQMKGITPKDVMTLGDSYNDLNMLDDRFGYPVAMGNAIDEVKKQAKYLTDTNDNDGVGKAIERFILG